MTLLRVCRVNAALTIQLFSQLFHFIGAGLFNRLVSSPRHANLCTQEWGHRLVRRLSRVVAWAEKQGLEVAAETHFQKLKQVSGTCSWKTLHPSDRTLNGGPVYCRPDNYPIIFNFFSRFFPDFFQIFSLKRGGMLLDAIFPPHSSSFFFFTQAGMVEKKNSSAHYHPWYWRVTTLAR